MHPFRRALGCPFVAALLVAQPAFTQPAFAQPANGGSSGPAGQAMMAGMTRMNRDMSSAPMTGNPDRDFVAMMIPHHQGAIDMAQVELRYGKDPSMRRLARNIVAAQQKEIGEMRGWQLAHAP